MPKPVGSDSTFRDAFLEGAARAFFVTAYADFVEEGFSTDNDLTDEDREARIAMPRATNGGDWYDYAPSTPPNAYALAGELWNALHNVNGEAGVYSLSLRAEAADGEAPDPEEFGRDLAMQAMGHGVSWFDDHAEFPIEIPHIECSMCSFSDDAYAPDENEDGGDEVRRLRAALVAAQRATHIALLKSGAKRTAGNSKLLAYVKEHYSRAIFRSISNVVNGTGGVTGAIETLLGYCRRDGKSDSRDTLEALA